jgi:hypothetical protein
LKGTVFDNFIIGDGCAIKSPIMKSIILWICFVIFTSIQAKAQVAFGFKAGYTRSSLNGSNAFDNSPLQSHTLGGFIQFGGFVFAVQPEILITQKGGHNYEMLDHINEEYKFNYLEIPVLFKAGIPLPNDVIFPHVFVGPYYASALTSSYVGSGGFNDVSGANTQRESFVYQRNLRQNDLGILGGAGVDIRLNRLFFTFDARYHLGLRTIDAGGNNYDQREIRNGMFLITGGVGVRFGY